MPLPIKMPMVSHAEIKAKADAKAAEERARERAMAAVNELKARGTEDSKNIAIALEFIIKRI